MLSEAQISEMTTALSLSLSGWVTPKTRTDILNTENAPTLKALRIATPLALSGTALAPFLKVKLSCTFAEFCEAYASYCRAVKLGQAFVPAKFFQNRLGLSHADAKYLFRSRNKPLADDTYAWKTVVGIPLAALVMWNFRSFIAKDDTKGFVVVSQGFEFGVKDGALVGPKEACKGMSKVKLAPKARVRECWTGQIRNSKSLFIDRAAKVLMKALPTGSGQAEALLLAFSILRHRTTDRTARRVLGHALDMDTQAGSIANILRRQKLYRSQAIKDCKNYAKFPNPYEDLRSTLVPVYLKEHAFKRAFGEAPSGRKFGHEPVEAWDEALTKLERTADAEQATEHG